MSTSSMYRMKPLFEMNSIDVNTTMYKIKNIHDAGIVCNGTSEEDDSYLEFIEGRQEDILKRLKKLRDLLEAPITIQCRPSTKIDSPSVPVSCTKMTVQAVDFVKHGVSQDVVLNANPSHLPYSLLGLPKLWGGIVTMNVSCHAHSSVRSLPQAAKVLQDELTARSSTSGDAVGHLNVRLVWKEVETDSVCVISPLKTVPIFGEVNFLRFVDSCIAPQRDAVRQTVLDDKMDSVFALAVDPKNATHAQNVFALLKSSKWLLDDSPSVLDLAAWSVVTRQSKSIHLDPKGKQWFDNATKLFS